jgi:hypothetical protein
MDLRYWKSKIIVWPSLTAEEKQLKWDNRLVYKPLIECPKCGCLYRSDGSELCPQRGLKQHKENS